MRWTNCKQNKVSVSGAATASKATRRSRDCWLQGESSGSEGNIKYCSLSPSVPANPTTAATAIHITITTDRPFHFARRHELPVQYTPVWIETSALKRSFINFVHALRPSIKRRRKTDVPIFPVIALVVYRIYYLFESSFFFKRKIILNNINPSNFYRIILLFDVIYIYKYNFCIISDLLLLIIILIITFYNLLIISYETFLHVIVSDTIIFVDIQVHMSRYTTIPSKQIDRADQQFCAQRLHHEFIQIRPRIIA